MDTKQLQQAFLYSGFKYLKIELEADVQPDDYDRSYPCDYCDEGRNECGDCEGSGREAPSCDVCEGSGIILDDNDQEQECLDCSGNGYIEQDCESCSGEGYFSCDNCSEGYIDNNDWEEQYIDDFEMRFKENLNGIDKHFKYLRVYHDGSVDTEATLTLRVDYIDELPEIIRVFKETCYHFGCCETQNAGLHITLLEGYKYPREKKLNQAKLNNFKQEVSKLLLGLVYLASPDEQTRSFQFRDLEISDKGKYSAIYTHNDTCLEYRLFDTCYNEPDKILGYLTLIAKTLKYYTNNPKKRVGIAQGVSLESSDKLLKKHRYGKFEKLTEVYNSRQSRMRLFDELSYLVNQKTRNLLNDVRQLNPCLISAELFNLIKQV